MPAAKKKTTKKTVKATKKPAKKVAKKTVKKSPAKKPAVKKTKKVAKILPAPKNPVVVAPVVDASGVVTINPVANDVLNS